MGRPPRSPAPSATKAAPPKCFTADVTDEQQVAGLAAAVAARLGPVDVLVLNATGPQPEAPLAAVAWEDHLAQLEFFVKSPVLLGRAVLPGMRARRSGRIIQIDSEVADRPPPGRSAYATAKNAQIGLARSWARQLAPSGVTVNTVAPGFIPVERHADVGPKVRNAYLASVPAGRMGTPEDVACAVSFFASGEAGFITGQRIVVERRARPGPWTVGASGDPKPRATPVPERRANQGFLPAAGAGPRGCGVPGGCWALLQVWEPV